MGARRQGKQPQPLPEDPRDRFLVVKRRINQERASGRFDEDDRERDAAVAEYVAKFVERCAANGQRPLDQRVDEFVLRYDDAGVVVGVERPTPSR